MGMYTEIYINVDLKKDTPSDIISILSAMCGKCDVSALEGKPNRWKNLFYSGSYYTPDTSCRNLTFDKETSRYSLLGKGDIKNYNDEIEQFFKWISPFIDMPEGSFIGYVRYESDRKPTLIFIEDQR